VRGFLLFQYCSEPHHLAAPHPTVGAQPPATGAGLLGRGGSPPPGFVLVRRNAGGGRVPLGCDAAVGGRSAAVGAWELTEVRSQGRRGGGWSYLAAAVALLEGDGGGGCVLTGGGQQWGWQ
jgi:hypothetical protein